MKKVFDSVLDKDEEIIEVFKPNKAKFYTISLLFSTLVLIPLVLWIPIKNIVLDNIDLWLKILLGLTLYVIAVIIAIVLCSLLYKNKYYAYTNKRLIIRKGIFGVDYKSLDIKSIGAMNIYASLLDKIVGKNTGTITFGSMSRPMLNRLMSFAFSNIENPLKVYKLIQDSIKD